MLTGNRQADLEAQVEQFVLEGISPRYGQVAAARSDPAWARLRELGSELWLDSGSMDDIAPVWTQDFEALTTNNTLLNKEVQTGAYDRTIADAAAMLDEFADLSPQHRMLEMAFILNARHGLRLVEKFDAYVSVEEHTDLANDVDLSAAYGRRYWAICPERFIIKVPLTPAGLVATRRLSDEGITVNHTLGFSARQAMLAAVVGRPAFVNVFLGRLNQFVADNAMGDGRLVGERAALAANAAIRLGRRDRGLVTRQIAASFRGGQQVRDLAGVDVLTIPPKAAREFLDLRIDPADLRDCTLQAYEPVFAEGVNTRAARFDTLWDIEPRFVDAIDQLSAAPDLTPQRLVDFLADRGLGDLLPRWTQTEMRVSAEEGKIPRFETWMGALGSRQIGLDSLMNLAGLNSFAADQKAMDDRVREVLSKGSRNPA